ncbi:RNA polymerase sigma-I factor (plasmid) [Rossellomorea sp. AcN35-11]|nr:RNA polymerase sigma-I factor [Rossellomorea aquimaris]WJV31883.1 RNA polymerase sigma-I factor [Rossellomorea sp. AcN35-11]
MLKTFRQKHKDNPSVQEIVEKIQKGDTRLRNDFIRDYQPFIASTTSEVCKRHIEIGKDDEFSVALEAFNNSIDKFEPTKNSSFLNFAKLIMKRKVIDYIRMNTKHKDDTSLDYQQGATETLENSAEISISMQHYDAELEERYRSEEIIEFQKTLTSYKLSFSELASVSPKHRDSKKNMALLAKSICANAPLKQKVIEKGKLPMKELETVTDLSRKTIERNRKYLISLILLLDGDFPYIQRYLNLQ